MVYFVLGRHVISPRGPTVFGFNIMAWRYTNSHQLARRLSDDRSTFPQASVHLQLDHCTVTICYGIKIVQSVELFDLGRRQG